MTYSRREILVKSLGAAFAYAGGARIAQFEMQDSRPASGPASRNGTNGDLLDQAIALAEKLSLPCVIIRIPNDKDEREAVGQALLNYVDSVGEKAPRAFLIATFADVHEVLLEAVYICGDDDTIRKRVTGTTQSDILIEVDANLQKVDAIQGTFEVLLDRVQFTNKARSLLHGVDNNKLKKRVATIRDSIARITWDEIEASIERPDGSSGTVGGTRYLPFESYFSPLTKFLDQVPTPEVGGAVSRPAVADVLLQLPKLGPWIALKRINISIKGDTKFEYRSKQIIHRMFEDANGRLEPRMPFGLQADGLHNWASGCGGDARSTSKGSFVCGMGSAGPIARKFMGFIK